MTEKPPYPEARRSYRVLGIAHAVLFGPGVALAGISEGYVAAGLVLGGVVAILTIAFFWRIADSHYKGDVPRKEWGNNETR